jgi:HAE1 family hydrophobic/amphiphilic exporter-1
MDSLLAFSQKVLDKAKANPSLQQADISYRTGKPEYQVVLKPEVAKLAGVTVTSIGQELRAQVQGQTPAVFRVSDPEKMTS